MLSKVEILEKKKGSKVAALITQGGMALNFTTPLAQDVLTEVGQELVEITMNKGKKKYVSIAQIIEIVV